MAGRKGWGGAGAVEYVSAAGLRTDGRRPGEVRRLKCEIGSVRGADGSALVELGQSAVLVSVTGPREVDGAPRASAAGGGAVKAGADHVDIVCTYSVAAFASMERVRRAGGGTDRRSLEAAGMVRSVVESAILAESLPRSRIEIAVNVLRADGGALSAAINATTLALVDAGVPLIDLACACVVGIFDSGAHYLVDINATETSAHVPELLLAALPSRGEIALVSMDSRVRALETIDTAMSVAATACEEIHRQLSSVVRAHVEELAASRGNVSF
mmetsp:Transcript_3468/g.9479  ORF Transcript_3468/g.9479 Transcript_3468/m.9479 type:complete len:272 (-) Transcript_3468:1474-2289(-)